MRLLLLTPLLLVGACNVSTDSNNSAMTVQYNQETAQNAASDVGNTAQNIGNAIANEADETASKVNNSGIVADHDRNQSSNKVDNRE